MAHGKARKMYRNKMAIVQPKLDKKMLSDEFYEDLKERTVINKNEKFKLYVYGHHLINGFEQTKEDWVKWLETKRELEIGKI